MHLISRLLILLLFAVARPLPAVSQEGVSLPSQTTEGGTHFVLNGMGLRTVSVFNISVYVAGLYLQAPNHDAEAILDAPDSKLLELHFLRDLDAGDVRHAWSEGFAHNCPVPCQLDQEEVARFMETVISMRHGDVARFYFSAGAMRASLNNHPLGMVSDPYLARVILGTFLGPHPASPQLKDALLGHPP